jgi:hypothetical protein
VQVAEGYADGLVPASRLFDTWRTVAADAGTPGRYGADDPDDAPARLAARAASPDPWYGARHAFYDPAWAEERDAQCELVRDLLGNPHRPPALDPAWLAWNDRTVLKIAHAIYADRHFEDLPVLADALEDAGCTDAAILDHCRRPGEHVRGCWVVDLLLGKE